MSAVENARRFSGDAGWQACVDLVEKRLAEARAVLEISPAEKFQSDQGGVRALRNLLQDLTGQKR